MKKTRKALLSSVFALLMSVTMLIGATFAWFTDNATSSSNIIKSGNLDLKMYWTDSLTGGQWYDVEDPDHNTIFNYDNWEPGYTDVRYIKIVNNGNLAFNYNLAITPVGEVGKLAEVINVFYGTDKNGIQVNSEDDLDSLNSIGLLQGVLNGRSTANGTLLAQGQSSPLHNSGEEIITIAMNMITTAGNEYQEKSIGDGFKITALATQSAYEQDSFGSSYDSSATYPDIVSEGQVSSTVTTENGKVAEGGIELAGTGFSAVVPEGVELENGVDRLTLTVTPLEESATNITTVNQEILIPVDVHVSGVSENNTTPIIVNLGAVMPKHLNMGNYTLYHVEDGENRTMTYIGLDEEFTAHNQFKYDPMTGELTLAMVSFSEVAILADEENAWNGTIAEKFSKGSGTEADPYIIANADELAYMGDRVSNDNANFGNKHYKLIADVNIGGAEAKDSDGNPVIWYPIGYNKKGGEIATVSLDEIYFEPINSAQPGDKDGDVVASIGENSWYTYGGAFEGVFDGNGHTISNIYQNTWAMKGNYDGHYYNAAMGLFGYVNGGTVKNLTIDHFNSEGEFAPTGCVTAYADGTEKRPATFENISITNSHPQTYNTGVAGVVGWNNADGMFLNFKNITVDETNTISALWGSWDVAASGILGSLKNDSHAYFENCHVAATIDVYNDVCGNYQYYWYRYSGAFIGTVYRRLDNGNGALDLSKVTAIDCTVNFGDRHQYYYCEFEKNTQASYTEDYQFSRVPHEELNMEENPVTCKHTHTDNEDKQAVYLPYEQLFGGYGWGVNGIDLEKYQAQYGNTIDITDNTTSVKKFDRAEKAKDEYTTGAEIKIADLFKEVDDIEVEIKKNNVKVFVSPVGEDSNVSAEYIQNTIDWTQGTLKFNGLGKATITITDYYFCETTTINVTITERKDVEKFETKFNNAYTYRVGNANTVSLGSMFELVDEMEIGNVDVTISNKKGNANGTYTVNTTAWTKGTIQFTGTGLVELTITDNDYCMPTTLELEVVDAVNATSATSATKNNVVLLNDVGLHTIEVSGGYTLYGNGFKMEAKSDVMYDAMGAGFVVLKNGTLDNVQVICPNFSYAIVYNNQIKSSENTAVPSDSSNDARGNVRSAVMVDGNSKIINSYIHGGRAAIFFRSGNLLVDNSTVRGGAAANIHTMSAQSLTLRDVTLIQKPFEANVNDTAKTIMGFSGLFECDENGNATPLILEGTLIQDAWINESYTKYVPSAATSIVSAALDKKDYIHDLDGDKTNESLNLGFVYIPQNSGGTTKATVTDNRTNMNSVPYGSVDVGNMLASATVYSYKNTNGTSDDFTIEDEFTPSVQGTTAPTMSFTDVNADRVFETKFDTSDNRWESSLTVNLDNGDYTFSFNKLLAQKHGENLNYTVETASGTKVDTAKAIALTASGVTDYVLTVTDDDGVKHIVYFTLTATKTSIPEPEVADTTGGTPLLVVKSKNSDWSCAIPALEGIKIKYWTSANNSVTLDLATVTPTSTGKQNGTNNYWEYSNGYKLKVTCGYIHDTKQIYGMPVVVNNGGNKMYFTISSTNGYVSTSTSGRTVTLTYEFTDPNGKTLTFSKTWQFNYVDYKSGTQYSYSDFANGTLKEASSSCVTPDTLVTLADGSEVRVDSLTGSEQLLVWNHATGKFESIPVAYIVNHDKVVSEQNITHLYFTDNSDIKIIGEHVFYDATLNKYVAITKENACEYMGHKFVGINDKNDGLNFVELVKVEQYKEETSAYEVVSYEHLTCFTNGILSTSAYLDKLLNIFDINLETMTYATESVQKDIETYGLYTYADFDGLISEEAFELYNAQYLKVAVGKGYITWDDILDLIDIYFNVDVQPIK